MTAFAAIYPKQNPIFNFSLNHHLGPIHTTPLIASEGWKNHIMSRIHLPSLHHWMLPRVRIAMATSPSSVVSETNLQRNCFLRAMEKESVMEILLEAIVVIHWLDDKLGDHFGDLAIVFAMLATKRSFWKIQEILALSLPGAEISRTFERLLYDVTSCWEKYKKQALKPGVSQLKFGQKCW
ncbi:hypothetical protein AVEN_183648-1 [Araneus ventricosus]|uniref:Uncharacterized protein n=1 Tax=Araneus ventricosus TaxID=182803 RepID=A0A4Y2I1Q6_ARAVE|nr:hypothetical protein AVEN_183648-1 [Araneus ventricosus]